MFDSDFYHGSIRKMVILFGSLFAEINITREDANGNTLAALRVPLTYAPKDKMLARVLQDPNIDRPTAVNILPRMSFEMTNMYYDSYRKPNTLSRISKLSTNANKLKVQYAPVPYNFEFKLYIYVKNAEDGTKIVEQICPYFTPDWTVTAELIPDMDEIRDVPVVLHSNIEQQDTYDSEMKNRRAIIWTLTFTVKGFLYGRIKDKPIIKFINVSAYESNTGNDAITTISIKPGLLANGSPTSNSSQSIAASEIYATDDFGYITDIEEGM